MEGKGKEEGKRKDNGRGGKRKRERGDGRKG